MHTILALIEVGIIAVHRRKVWVAKIGHSLVAPACRPSRCWFFLVARFRHLQVGCLLVVSVSLKDFLPLLGVNVQVLERGPNRARWSDQPSQGKSHPAGEGSHAGVGFLQSSRGCRFQSIRPTTLRQPFVEKDWHCHRNLQKIRRPCAARALSMGCLRFLLNWLKLSDASATSRGLTPHLLGISSGAVS